jgi:hypothetical protein
MSITTSISDLTMATNNLLNAVNVSKASLMSAGTSVLSPSGLSDILSRLSTVESLYGSMNTQMTSSLSTINDRLVALEVSGAIAASNLVTMEVRT